MSIYNDIQWMPIYWYPKNVYIYWYQMKVTRVCLIYPLLKIIKYIIYNIVKLLIFQGFSWDQSFSEQESWLWIFRFGGGRTKFSWGSPTIGRWRTELSWRSSSIGGGWTELPRGSSTHWGPWARISECSLEPRPPRYKQDKV